MLEKHFALVQNLMSNLQGESTARFSVIQVYFISIIFHLISYYYNSINKFNIKAKLKTGIVVLLYTSKDLNIIS